MSRERIAYPNPPLAGRPPFATDEPESIYQTGPSVQARYRQPRPNPSMPHSAFNTHDKNQDERDPFRNPPYTAEHIGSSNQGVSIPLAAPRPGYAAPVAALNLPSPVATSDSRMHQDTSQMFSLIPLGVPNTPHPLQAPLTPISPVFAKPSGSPALKDVKFTSQKQIIRGDNEGTIIPKRGEKGDDFWRRFSTVVHEEKKTRYQSSNWLKKTQSGSSRLNRWVWLFALFLIACIAGACVLGWYFSKNISHNVPEAVGGKENQKAEPTSATASSLVAGGIATSTTRHVSPTFTLNNKREPLPSPTPSGALGYYAIPTLGRQHRRSHLRRIH